MRSFILIITLLFSLKSSSEANPNSLEPILRRIEQINTSGFPFNQQCGESCLVPAVEDESALLQQCAVDICGPPNKSPRYLINNTNFSQDVDPSILSDFDQKIEPSISSFKTKLISFIERILGEITEEETFLNSDPNTSYDEKIEIENIKQKTKELHSQLTNTSGDNGLNYCKSSFIERAQFSKTIKKYEDNLPQYAGEIIRTTFSNYSDKSRQQFEKYVKTKLHIKIPPVDPNQFF